MRARTGIDRSTSGQIARRLVRNRLLQRRRSRKDARAKVLNLTNDGRRLLEAAEPVARNVDAVLLGTPPKSRQTLFLAALQAIVRTLEAALYIGEDQ
jgi:DNA-binding MarR family transcriptional regulator